MSKSSPVDRDTAGPFDISEIGVLTPYLDFGSIRLAPRRDMQIRADIDDSSKKVVALTVEIEGHRLQLQAFASTKSDGLWEATMSALIQGISSQGGSVAPVEGILGQELRGTAPGKERGSNYLSSHQVHRRRWSEMVSSWCHFSLYNQRRRLRSSGVDFPFGSGQSWRHCNASGRALAAEIASE